MSHKFTTEQIAWLTANRYELNNIEVVKQFNQHFNLNLVQHQVTQACIRRGIKHKTNGFQKGHVTWNKDLKGVNGFSSTKFKKGQISVNLLPIGTERLTKEGYINIKLADPNVWAPKHVGQHGAGRAFQANLGQGLRVVQLGAWQVGV